MNASSPIRRGTLAALAVAIAAFILRPQLAQALVVRGDDQLFRGKPSDALRYYARAAQLNRDDYDAVDRFLFVSSLLRDVRALDTGIDLATSYLRRHDDVRIRWDRAMAYRALARFSNAETDFALVGVRSRNAAAFTFAGSAAARAGDRRTAIAYWRRAASLAPALPAAKHALMRVGAQR